MSGHSKWKKIKHKKEATDKKRSQVFSKLLTAIRIAAKDDPNPDFNPLLRSSIEKAKESQVPQDNIERALKQAKEKNIEGVVVEAYGPGGIAIIIEAVTDNRNRTISEIKNLLNDGGGKFSEPGSVKWTFDPPDSDIHEWNPKFEQKINDGDKQKLEKLTNSLEEHDDVQGVYTNAKL